MDRDLAPMAYAIRAKGMTTLNDAIVEAAKTLADRPEVRKAIVVLSDGMDTFSKASSDKAVESALAVGASIYAVDMSSLEVAGSADRQSAASLKGICGEDWRKIYRDARWTSVARCVYRHRGRAWAPVHDLLSAGEYRNVMGSGARWK